MIDDIITNYHTQKRKQEEEAEKKRKAEVDKKEEEKLWIQKSHTLDEEVKNFLEENGFDRIESLSLLNSSIITGCYLKKNYVYQHKKRKDIFIMKTKSDKELIQHKRNYNLFGSCYNLIIFSNSIHK